jgi:hypothetical protein
MLAISRAIRLGDTTIALQLRTGDPGVPSLDGGRREAQKPGQGKMKAQMQGRYIG